MKRILLSVLAALIGVSSVKAQDNNSECIPYDVFYLMPQMGKGTIMFNDRGPVNGSFNICAIDNTVRFLDAKGTELCLESNENLLSVVIDGITFLYRENEFYRLERVTGNTFVAIRREVRIHNDKYNSSYGMDSQTTAIDTYDGFEYHGYFVRIADSKGIPYIVSESASLYLRGMVLPPTKKNFIKCFPSYKEEINAWFKENRKVDASDVETVTSLCKQWAK